MRIRYGLLVVSLLASYQVYADFATGLAVGIATGSANATTSEGGEVFISRIFDYAVACKVEYEKLRGDTYRYYCPNPPKEDSILFMSTVFNTDHWPSRIIYYMKQQ